MNRTRLRELVAGTMHRGAARRRRPGRGAVIVAVVVAVAGVASTIEVASRSHAGRGTRAAPPGLSSSQPHFGPNVYIFTPRMTQYRIQRTVDSIARRQISNQFGSQRFALLFEPGTYGSTAHPLSFQVGYYTEVAGLGGSPGDVTIDGSINVYNQCFPPTAPATSNCNALENFWRSLSNLTVHITGQSGCRTGADFWATSQAAPMRRVHITGGNLSLMDYCSAGPRYASGGFIADSAFSGGTVINGSQQQFLVRNSDLDGWSNGVWNQVFAGDTGAPAQSFSGHSGHPGGTAPYTSLVRSPLTREEPLLQTDPAGSYSVFVPALEHNSSGPSWAKGPTPGTRIPIQSFLLATPTTPVAAMNAGLALGRDLILSPGVYHLPAPIVVCRPDTVVIGLGFATLVPQNGTAAMQVLSVPGVKLSGLILAAGPKISPVLLQVGEAQRTGDGRATDPTLVQDVFFRIGGGTAGEATDSLVVDNSDVILDDIWAWRADHGPGVGWTHNIAATGVRVDGNDVTAYGLAVEHYEKTEVIWNGQRGTEIFFQNEMPYDPPDQASWTLNATTTGYPAFLVSQTVRSFQGYGMGSYSYFDRGVPIEASTAFRVPDTPGVRLHDAFTVYLSGSGGIQSVVNGTGAPVDASYGGPSDIVTYP